MANKKSDEQVKVTKTAAEKKTTVKKTTAAKAKSTKAKKTTAVKATKPAKKADKPYKKEFDAIVKESKPIGHITYDELEKKIQTPYSLNEKDMEGLLENIEDSGISVVDENGDPDPRAIDAAKKVTKKELSDVSAPTGVKSMILLECI